MKQRDEAIIRVYRQRRQRTLLQFILLFVLALCWFAAAPLLAPALGVERDSLEPLILIPAVVLTFSAHYSLRCPACEGVVRRFFARYCPTCGAQLIDRQG